MRIQHPRATDAFARGPPSRVAVPLGDGRYVTRTVDTEGYIDIADSAAEAAMDGLKRAYGVTYDRETGDVIDAPIRSSDTAGEELAAGNGDHGADANAGGDAGGDASDSVGDDPDHVTEWANWNEEDWLALNYQQRETDVLKGRVDDHLDEIKAIERSETVEAAVETRRADLESEDGARGEDKDEDEDEDEGKGEGESEGEAGTGTEIEVENDGEEIEV